MKKTNENINFFDKIISRKLLNYIIKNVLIIKLLNYCIHTMAFELNKNSKF